MPFLRLRSFVLYWFIAAFTTTLTELDIEDVKQLPTRLQEDDARECEYDQLLDEIRSKLDLDSADPCPRHTEDSGASIAVTLDAYLRVGGFPLVLVGEDKAFIAALRRLDMRIRHSPDVCVVVSGLPAMHVVW